MKGRKVLSILSAAAIFLGGITSQLPAGPAKVEIGGEMELEYKSVENEEIGEAVVGLDKAVLKPKVTFEDSGVKFKAEFEFKEDKGKTKFEEGGVTFTRLPGGGKQKLFIGLNEPFVKAKRHTENYPMLGTALWRDEVWQTAWEASEGPTYLGLMAGIAFSLDNKQVGEYKYEGKNKIWQFGDGGNEVEKCQYGVKLGTKREGLDIVGYGFFGKLNKDEIDLLKKDLPDYTSDSKDMSFYGGRMVYEPQDLELVGEFAKATLGREKITTWYAQVAYDIKTEAKTFWKKFIPVVRHGQWKTDSENTDDKPLSWDRTKTLVGVITKLTDKIKIKTEYAMFEEETGGENIDNNEFLTQMEVKF